MHYFCQFKIQKRLYEIIAEGKSRLQSQMTGSGHTIAAIRAMSYFSRTGAINEQMNGITQYRFYDELEQHFEERYKETVEKLRTLCHVLFRKENLMADIEKLELLCLAGGKIKWCGHCGRQYRSSSES